MKYTILIALLLCTTQIFAQSAVVRQHSTAQGFGVSVLAGVLVVDSEDFEADSESGFNFGLGVSYGFTELISAFAQFQYAPGVNNKAAFGENYSFSNFEIGARFHFASTLSTFRPFVDVSYVITSLNLPVEVIDDFGNVIASTDYLLDGGGIGFGVGAAYHVTIPFCIIAELRLNPGTFNNEELVGFYEGEVDLDVTTFRFNVGGTYRF